MMSLPLDFGARYCQTNSCYSHNLPVLPPLDASPARQTSRCRPWTSKGKPAHLIALRHSLKSHDIAIFIWASPLTHPLSAEIPGFSPPDFSFAKLWQSTWQRCWSLATTGDCHFFVIKQNHIESPSCEHQQCSLFRVLSRNFASWIFLYNYIVSIIIIHMCSVSPIWTSSPFLESLCRQDAPSS